MTHELVQSDLPLADCATLPGWQRTWMSLNATNTFAKNPR
jgi:hypothetical protein